MTAGDGRTAPGYTLDPDALAALVEERDFLLRSIEDLQREHAAGDIDEDDFAQLSDDYTVRTAEVLRAIDQKRAAFESAPRRSPARTVMILGAIVVVGILAGVFVAQSSGRRKAGETVSGAGVVPRTATQEARDCVGLTGGGEVGKALDCYRKVLDRDPENPTALTYLGWTLVLSSGSIEGETGQQALSAGRDFIARAVKADPTFPDAYAFQAIVADREGRPADAKAALDKLDALDPPPEIRSLTAPLRKRIEQDVVASTTTSTTTSTGP